LLYADMAVERPTDIGLDKQVDHISFRFLGFLFMCLDLDNVLGG